MSDQMMENLDQEIVQAQEYVERLKEMRKLLSENPKVKGKLNEICAAPSSNGHVTVPKSASPTDVKDKPKDKRFHRLFKPVCKYFESLEPGTWVRIAQIAHAIGEEDHNVHSVVRKKHPEYFNLDERGSRTFFFQLKKHPKGPVPAA